MKNLQPSISYFNSLITKEGIVQFSKGDQPNFKFGYAIEDQARALIVALLLKDQLLIDSLLSIILDFQITENGIIMLKTDKGNYLKKVDYFGEASAEVLWALSFYRQAINSKEVDPFIEKLIKGLQKADSIRTISYSLLGLNLLDDKKNIKYFADKLIRQYEKHQSLNWDWFEDKMTYANSLMPWSLILSFKLTKDKKYLEVGLKSFEFLLNNLKHLQTPFVVGNKGWWEKGKKISLFDQQPIDISYMVLACLDIFNITSEERYLKKALFYYSFFEGNNLSQLNMIRKEGGCCDGLLKNGVNKNSGAESTVCYLLASLKIQQMIDMTKKKNQNNSFIYKRLGNPLALLQLP